MVTIHLLRIYSSYLKKGGVIKGNIFLNNSVGIGSNMQIEGLDETYIFDNSERLTEWKQSNTDAVLHTVVPSYAASLTG